MKALNGASYPHESPDPMVTLKPIPLAPEVWLQTVNRLMSGSKLDLFDDDLMAVIFDCADRVAEEYEERFFEETKDEEEEEEEA